MNYRNLIISCFLICVVAFSGCKAKTPGAETTTKTPSPIEETTPTATETPAPTTEATPTTTATPASVTDTKPATNDELFEYIISKWKQGQTEDLYEYADVELSSLLSKDSFTSMFENISNLGGTLNDITNKQVISTDGIATYTADLNFDNITTNLTLAIKDLKICGITYNNHFKHTFEINYDNNITEQYFLLENKGYRLNAVYTYVNDENSHPAVLLIAGSGPSDYNETLGILAPFEDIALGLAENGINSLRVDKRTLNYASDFGNNYGIKDEYLEDCSAAISFLQEQNCSGLYLFGHSLGGQIAAELATTNDDISGILLFNSSARHLADIMCDQYTALDPANITSYTALAESAKHATDATSQGHYYYGVPDTYWASYNQTDTGKSITDTNVKALIINSASDRQIFEADISLWDTLFKDNKNVTIQRFDDISHFGYKIDTSDPAAVYQHMEFPKELITAFTEFIKNEP